jgi:hypothetical protein
VGADQPLGDIVLVVGMVVSAETVRAISAGEPKRCVYPATSAKASSTEMRSTEGVKSLRTAMASVDSGRHHVLGGAGDPRNSWRNLLAIRKRD